VTVHPNPRRPTFLIGGSLAGGTSFLSATLLQHERIFMPPDMRPEPSFFFKTWEYSRGLDYYCNRWFAEVPEVALAIGERSSQYLFGGSTVAARINDLLPDVKILFVLRNPIERAWANYRFTVLEGLEDQPFAEALAAEPDRTTKAVGIWKEIQPHAYIGRGFYGEQLAGYLEFFDKSNILVLKSEDLAANTEHSLTSVYSFLGVPHPETAIQPVSDFSSTSVLDPQVQFLARNYFGERFPTLVEAIRQDVDLRTLAVTKDDLRWTERIRRNLTLAKNPIPLDCAKLLRDLYADDISKLSQLVNFQVDDWLTL
jgi:hypothetical protein